eukprot:gb/GECH01000947.1/.p1 GENE.gb/GECH01000947.1/~~gb/GECH01000947.1/.p1  ORF type:complete len:771 (+),score=155.76 gb/GECH01000947.1/:1-2313(+)
MPPKPTPLSNVGKSVSFRDLLKAQGSPSPLERRTMQSFGREIMSNIRFSPFVTECVDMTIAPITTELRGDSMTVAELDRHIVLYGSNNIETFQIVFFNTKKQKWKILNPENSSSSKKKGQHPNRNNITLKNTVFQLSNNHNFDDIVTWNLYLFSGTEKISETGSIEIHLAEIKSSSESNRDPTFEWLSQPQIHGDQISSRTHFSVCQINDVVYIFGGKTAKGSSSELFELKRDKHGNFECSRIRPSHSVWPESRFGHAASSLHGRMFVFGGENESEDLNNFYMFDPEKNHWTEVITECSPPALSKTALISGSSPKYLYLIGGKRGSSLHERIYRFNMGECCWELITVKRMHQQGEESSLVPLKNHAAVIANHNAYIFGGSMESKKPVQSWFGIYRISDEGNRCRLIDNLRHVYASKSFYDLIIKVRVPKSKKRVLIKAHRALVYCRCVKLASLMQRAENTDEKETVFSLHSSSNSTITPKSSPLSSPSSPVSNSPSKESFDETSPNKSISKSKQKQSNMVELEIDQYVSPAAVEAYLEFLYCGDIHLQSKSDAEHLLSLAQRLMQHYSHVYGICHGTADLTTGNLVQQQIKSDLEPLYNDVKYSDVDLVLSSGKQIPSHKIILLGSEYFKRQLKGNKGRNLDRLEVPEEIKEDEMWSALRYLYTGQGELSEKNCVAVYRCAKILEMEQLMQECRILIRSKFTVKNIFDMLNLSMKPNDDSRLTHMVLLFMKHHVDDISGTKEFDQLSQNHKNYLLDRKDKLRRYPSKKRL